jgi:hypothetical protein
MRFSKIKYNGAAVELQWVVGKEFQTAEVKHVLKSIEPPAPQLLESLNAFLPFVAQLLELPEVELGQPTFMDEVWVSGLALNEEEGSGRRGIVITCRKPLKGARAPLIFNTPHLREDLDLEGPGFMLRGMMDAIEDAERAAQAFVNGERAQGELFDREAVSRTFLDRLGEQLADG